MDLGTTSNSTCTDCVTSSSITSTPRGSQNGFDDSWTSIDSCSSWSLNVSFSQTITVREIPSYRDYSPDEIINTWYTNDDIRSWKSKCRRMVRNEIPIDCHRGLEGRFPDAANQKRQTKRAARMAVLQEQQLLNGRRQNSG